MQKTDEKPQPVREPLSMKALLESGVHFGHQTRRWNPRMKTYIFSERNGIHIIDLQQTLGMLDSACRAVNRLVAEGGTVLFVGTKKQAQETIKTEATRCGMPYVNSRWLGGTLTNFQTIEARIDYLIRLEEQTSRGDHRNMSKKEAKQLDEEIARLNRYFGGMKNLTRLPDALFVIDIGKEYIAVNEARKLHISVAAVVDTDCDPDKVDWIIPGNDDAIRSIRLVTSRVADAVLDGLARRRAQEIVRIEAEEEKPQPEAVLMSASEHSV
ncbi:MAG: 30S ribosomal protein S2 [Chloroflexi bacterium]|nr:30S ribosomal protein S2 [Chloroflexota bacterium]